jgi:hypothetical protein
MCTVVYSHRPEPLGRHDLASYAVGVRFELTVPEGTLP